MCVLCVNASVLVPRMNPAKSNTNKVSLFVMNLVDYALVSSIENIEIALLQTQCFVSYLFFPSHITCEIALL
jgi:hypothetical protein